MEDNKNKKVPNVPTLRFPEFSGEWKLLSFVNLYKIVKINEVINKNQYLKVGNTPIIDQGNELICGYSNQIGCKLPTIVYGDHTTYCKYIDFEFLVGSDGTKSLRSKNDNLFNLHFLYYCLLKNNLASEGYKRHFPILKTKDFYITTNKLEQTKIANFLSLIDKRIELQNKIIKDYELLKKEINIKMFTHSPKLPTLRFKEFKNDLAIKKIKNIVEYSKSGGGTPNTSIKEYYNGTIPFLSISDITVQSKYIYSTNKHITELGLKNSSTWIVPINTVTLTMYASFGIPCIIKNNMCTSQAMYNMIINKNNNYEYVYYYLNFLKNIRYYNSLAEQGSQFNLNSSIIKNINLFLPSLKEQLKIANFLSKLDEILLNVKCEKERLIKNKTFLLQNLFI